MGSGKFHISYVFGVAGWICAILAAIAKGTDTAIGYGGDFWIFLALFLVLFAICTKVEHIRSGGGKS
ncbi:MAG: hypothetical protein PVJ08_00360 [Dehalococcoidia bacterium]|jgi:hypothetical protein